MNVFRSCSLLYFTHLIPSKEQKSYLCKFWEAECFLLISRAYLSLHLIDCNLPCLIHHGEHLKFATAEKNPFDQILMIYNTKEVCFFENLSHILLAIGSYFPKHLD